jgi:hypothetical protein
MRVPGCAVQVTVRTASVIFSPSDSIGTGSGCLITCAVHPDIGFVLTELSGWSAGSATSNLIVPAVADSFGVRERDLGVAALLDLAWLRCDVRGRGQRRPERDKSGSAEDSGGAHENRAIDR